MHLLLSFYMLCSLQPIEPFLELFIENMTHGLIQNCFRVTFLSISSFRRLQRAYFVLDMGVFR